MRLIAKLIGAQYRRHWLRTALTFSAVIACVAMVVVVIGGQTATAVAPDAAALKSVGSFDLVISAGSRMDVEADRKRAGANAPLPPFAQGTIAWLRRSPAVKFMSEECEMVVELPDLPASAQLPLLQLTPRLIGPKPNVNDLKNTVASLTPGSIPPVAMPLMGTNSAQPVRPLERGRWLDESDAAAVVLDGDVARRIQRGVGDSLEITTVTGKHTVKVVGILRTAITIEGLTGIYVNPRLFSEMAGAPMRVNRVLVQLKEGESEEAFRGDFLAVSHAGGGSAEVRNIQALLGTMAKTAIPAPSGAQAFPPMRNASAKLAIVAAMFIIFNTFSMGVRERTRQLGMLRAIGMMRWQISVMVWVEGFLAAVVGWVAGTLIAAAVLWQSAGTTTRSGLKVQLALEPVKLLELGAVTAFGAVFAAALAPTVMASRRRPLDGMAGSSAFNAKSAPLWMAIAGLILIVLNPLAAYFAKGRNPAVPGVPGVLVSLSYVAALVGFVFLIPSLLQLLEMLLVRVVARILFLNRQLLRRQLVANLWRTVGCVSALMVGLGFYLLVQIWGHSMAAPFLITRCPDAVAIVSPHGIPESRLAELNKLRGVEAVLPLILKNPVLADLPPYANPKGLDFFSTDMMLLGCDMTGLMDHQRGMFDGIFVRGNKEQAYRDLARGDSCLITDNLWRRVPEKYDVGKTITMTTGEIPHRTMTYKIAGVVEMDGWHQFSQRTRMRRNAGRSGGMVMVPVATAKAAYPDAEFQTLWFKLKPGTDPFKLAGPIVKMAQGAGAGGVARGRAAHPLATGEAGCEIFDGRAIVTAQRALFTRVIDSIAYYPLWALVLASLAVTNTLFASIRARSWEIGILRSIGQTQGQVVRHILAEGILIGLIAGAMSLLFALLATKAGIVASTRQMDVAAPYLVPWSTVGLAIAGAVALCLGASVIPAFSVVRREPLRLLQDGRTMT